MASIKEQGDRWLIEGDVLMDNASDLLAQSQSLTFGNQLVIDFAQVQEVDTAAVSLMLAWRRRANAENKQLIFDHLPHGLVTLTALYEVNDIIN